MTDLPSVTVRTQGRPVILELVAKGVIGGKTMLLEDSSGMMQLKFPTQLWEWIEPGDLVHMTFSPVKIIVEPVQPSIMLPGLRKDN